MARYSRARWRPLAAGHQAAMTSHDFICLHTMVGFLTSTDAMFHQNGWSGTESHFGVGGKWGGDKAADLNGVVYQWGDTAYKADANLNGNMGVISIETADNAPRLVEDIAGWTPEQIDAIVRLVTWLCSKEAHKDCPSHFECHKVGIPARLVPDTKPGRRGIAYHRQGCKHSTGFKPSGSGWLVKGGVQWSGAVGKGCPGPARIAQLKAIVIPRVVSALNPPKPKPPVEKPDPPKEPSVAALTKDDLSVKLTSQYMVDQMNSNNGPSATPWKLGDELTYDRLAKWGGPAAERVYNLLVTLTAALDEEKAAREATALSLATIEGKVNDLASTLIPSNPTGESRSV